MIKGLYSELGKMKFTKIFKLFFVIYFSIFLPLLSTYVSYSNLAQLQMNPLSYSKDCDNEECAIIEINYKNFNKLSLNKIALKFRQGFNTIEKSSALVSIIIKISSQLNSPLRC